MSSSSSISIQDDSFENLASLQSLSLSSVSITISGSCFKGTGLSSISIKATSSVTIQDKAFRNCKSLKTVELSGASVTVDGLIFSYCTELNSFTIEAKSSANIQSNAFCGCAKLTEEDIHITAVSTNINKDAFSCDKDDGDDGDGNKELEPIKFILPVKKGGKLRPIDITLVDKERGPSVSSLKLLEDLPIRIHSKLPELSNIDLRNFKINLNYDQTKYHVDKSDLPVSLQKLVNEKDTNGKKGINIALIAGVAAAAVVVIVIIIVVVVVVIKKKKKKKSKDEKSTEQSTAEVV
ncbi:hypothetical protein M9Y10_005189 [Tritrichomonas musculus]|uniref:Surface antigen BspA-like n=1 Tax=Tritrichomonas musculus TaxID=1915356 RepID=A0ABR2JKK9_9EUKA